MPGFVHIAAVASCRYCTSTAVQNTAVLDCWIPSPHVAARLYSKHGMTYYSIIAESLDRNRIDRTHFVPLCFPFSAFFRFTRTCNMTYLSIYIWGDCPNAGALISRGFYFCFELRALASCLKTEGVFRCLEMGGGGGLV